MHTTLEGVLASDGCFGPPSSREYNKSIAGHPPLHLLPLLQHPRHIVLQNHALNLLAVYPLAVDQKGFGHARRPQCDLHAALHVGTDAVERIAVLAQEGRDILGPVADRDAVDRHPRGLERLELRRLGAARDAPARENIDQPRRSEEHTSELQSLMRISYAVFCLKKNKK